MFPDPLRFHPGEYSRQLVVTVATGVEFPSLGQGTPSLIIFSNTLNENFRSFMRLTA
jgi:hypothetical protein